MIQPVCLTSRFQVVSQNRDTDSFQLFSDKEKNVVSIIIAVIEVDPDLRAL